jgi:methyltransferase (TIGR00027 family)
MAVYRANESDRPDAVFRDPFARTLAGERGQQILKAMPFAEDNAWPFIARTYLFDRHIAKHVRAGVDLVLNLAAGLDTRPYRMDLPASLRWVEVDLPDILDYKEEVLGDAKPVCALERVRVDLSNHDARRGLFARIGRSATNVLVATEGLLLYLMPDEVCTLGRDLAAQPSFGRWVNDIMSPGLKTMLIERIGEHVQQAGAPFLFAPPEGPAFFEACGWKAVEVTSMLKTARKLDRLPIFLRMMAMLPESAGPQGSRPWSGVCAFERTAA